MVQEVERKRINEVICALIGIPSIDEIDGRKLCSNFETVNNGKIEKRDHISIIKDGKNSCLYVMEMDLDGLQIFKKLGGPSEYYYEWEERFYRNEI